MEERVEGCSRLSVRLFPSHGLAAAAAEARLTMQIRGNNLICRVFRFTQSSFQCSAALLALCAEAW
ncbi:uncharacterized protein V6R79_009689 [Siganus canaliculatus]